ncbi:ABC1 family-domain-containing protein [Syncephalis pseudoplumigaleata]|uniref:ABC1 family-domain-containing protein n=1 Tax=Syncephalis pseudoplumigaleata TaxID=1712513 RepID=A0A4P9YYX1_9FUNG|nr:ABC1 family-domain-containing protein [Syncephalis pseudoplumigaleata]|eukprot:RKP24772.1 ABC1 family-domain-containing protein [Syncephalis pseudoplumigaleata]
MQARLGHWAVRTAIPCTLVGGAAWAWDRWYGARVLSRSTRAIWAAGQLALDYKWNFQADRSADALSALHRRAAERILHVCQRNGGLYTKFGQALALQSALLPPEYNKVMQVLLDDAPFSSYTEVERIIVDELGDSPKKLFRTFEEEPVASASIAQVHRATLHDGTAVAVKVQKPEIPRQIEWDLRVHTLLMKFFEWAFDLPITWAGAFVQEHLRQEIDFVREARNAQRCAQAIADEPRLRDDVHVPFVFTDYSGKRVLTCEWMDGRRLADVDALKAMGYNMTEIMKTMVDLFAYQIFVTGFVHCDPHPGNLLVRPHPDGPARRPQLVLLDHGLYLQCREHFRREHCQLWKSLFTNDHHRLTEICHQWGIREVGMFASATLMRPYQQGQSAAALSTPVSAQDVYSMQLQAKERARGFLMSEQQFPRELILVARNMNMIRAYNQALGSPVNRIGRMADWAVRGLGADWDEWPAGSSATATGSSDMVDARAAHASAAATGGRYLRAY